MRKHLQILSLFVFSLPVGSSITAFKLYNYDNEQKVIIKKDEKTLIGWNNQPIVDRYNSAILQKNKEIRILKETISEKDKIIKHYQDELKKLKENCNQFHRGTRAAKETKSHHSDEIKNIDAISSIKIHHISVNDPKNVKKWEITLEIKRAILQFLQEKVDSKATLKDFSIKYLSHFSSNYKTVDLSKTKENHFKIEISGKNKFKGTKIIDIVIPWATKNENKNYFNVLDSFKINNIIVNNPSTVEKQDLTAHIKLKVLHLLHKEEPLITSDDFTINYLDQFLSPENQTIDLSKDKNITIEVLGLNRWKGNKKITVNISQAQEKTTKIDINDAIDLLSITKIYAKNPSKVTKEELTIAINCEIYKLLQKKESSVTSNDWNFEYLDYFLWEENKTIDLSNSQIIQIKIIGKDRFKGVLETVITLPQASITQ